jgi:NADH pyrophosphatase NudC (nudix superfamily)
VHFYLMRYVRGDVRDHDHESDDARWFAIEQAMKQLKFATERKMVYRAMTMLTARPAAPQIPAAEGGA